MCRRLSGVSERVTSNFLILVFSLAASSFSMLIIIISIVPPFQKIFHVSLIPPLPYNKLSQSNYLPCPAPSPTISILFPFSCTVNSFLSVSCLSNTIQEVQLWMITTGLMDRLMDVRVDSLWIGQASGQTMNTVGAAACSVGAYTYLRLYTYVMIFI